MKFAAVAVFIAVFLAGCSLFDPLPPGTPPEGPIVQNTPPGIPDVSSAVNYMTTSLSIYLLTNPLKENVVALDADEATKPYAKMVLEEIFRISGTREIPPPCSCVLKTRAVSNTWSFQLLSQRKILWESMLSLPEERK